MNKNEPARVMTMTTEDEDDGYLGFSYEWCGIALGGKGKALIDWGDGSELQAVKLVNSRDPQRARDTYIAIPICQPTTLPSKAT